MKEDSKTGVSKETLKRNLGASIQQRLRNHARAHQEDVALVLLRYLNERFLYRLSQSPHQARFVLKGATLFSLWSDEPYRPTRDIDLTATGRTDRQELLNVFKEVCTLSLEEGEADGVVF